MAEQQPMYDYWDQQAAQQGASASTGSPRQQQQQSQQPQSSCASGSGQEQRFSLDSVDYSTALSSGSAPPFAGEISQQFGRDGHSSAAGGGPNNQESVRQLQQNLMLMLQQQSEQNAAGDHASIGNGSQRSQSSLHHQPPHLKHQENSGDNAKPPGMLPDQMFSASQTNDDPGDLMSQYQQMFGMQDNAPAASAPSRMNDAGNPNPGRLFALGGMMKPLPPNKQQPTASKSGKPQEISASSLGISESSSDFMMKLFQSDGGGSQQHQQQDFDHRFPFQQTNNPSITNGGSATAALQHLQTTQHQQEPAAHSFSGDFSLQQHQPMDLQEQLRQKQEQLRRLQQQLGDSQPQDPHQQQPGSLEVDSSQLSSQEDGFGLPCTMLPPSVLASMFSVETNAKPKAIPHKAGKSHIKARKRRYNVSLSGDDAIDMKPQDVLGELLDRRNYDKEHRFKADDSGYDAVPSPLQLASFGTHLVKAVQKSDIQLLSSLLECGLSPNPCNQFRDSVFFDLVIKRSNLPVFECLLNHGCDLQVVDGFGRTPLHHCCWASTFCRPIVEIILERDPVQIFLEDKHGQTPLEYVRANLYAEWNDFLEEVADKYWPMGGQPPRIMSPKERRPDGHLPDPENALSVTLASMLSSGGISPGQVASMDENLRRSYEN